MELQIEMLWCLAAISHPRIDPVVVRIGRIDIRWYGVAYLLGFVVAYLILRRLIRRGRLRVTAVALDDLIGWLILGVIIGGRLGYWIFYHRPEAPEPWYEPIAIWHGGMSFHGGVAGVVAAMYVWSWAKGAAFWNLADGLALAAPMGLFFGRIANFVNDELVGRPTTLPWGIIYPGEAFARHPSQIYEALLEGPLLLLLLWIAMRWRPRDGRLAAMFLMLYGVFRFAAEFTREPDAQIGFVAFGWLTMGQILSAILFLAGVIIWAVAGRLTPKSTPKQRAA